MTREEVCPSSALLTSGIIAVITEIGPYMLRALRNNRA